MIRHTRISIRQLVLFLSITVIFINSGCNSGSTVTESTTNNDTAQTAGPPSSPGPELMPSPGADPGSPVGPVGQTAHTSNDQGAVKSGDNRGTLMGGEGITYSKAKPALTPAPDPFPPRPTPTIVMKDGKIVQEWQASDEAKDLVNPVKDRPDAAKMGMEYYSQRCADCHGKSGKGNGWMSKGLLKPPTNLSSRMVQANTDGELFWKITNGRSPMPANRVRFTDEQRWYIVTYLRTLK